MVGTAHESPSLLKRCASAFAHPTRPNDTRPNEMIRLSLFLLLIVSLASPAYAGDGAVTARHGMVVAQEKHAAKIGAAVLERGGNAVDAAVATGFALAVTYPRAGNIGGGGYMVSHLARPNRQIAIDYRETAPKATTRDIFLNEKGEPDSRKSRDSALSIGVPGTVA